MAQAIIARYRGATATQPSRIIAKGGGCRVVLPYDHSLGIQANHDAAARKVAEKLGWWGNWQRGSLPDEAGWVYVCDRGSSEDHAFTIHHASKGE